MLRAPESVIRELLDAHQKSAGQVLRGTTLLHRALGFYKTEKYNIYDNSLRTKEISAELELVARALGSQSIGVVQLLLRLESSLISKSDWFGFLPLHAALIYSAPSNVVFALLEADPTSASAPCRIEQRTGSNQIWYLFKPVTYPVHLAIMYGASDEVVEAVLRKYPQAPRLPKPMRNADPHPQDIKDIRKIDMASVNSSRCVIETGFGTFIAALRATWQK